MRRVRIFTASPTAPSPNIATVEPFGGFAKLIDAPRPTERMATQHLKIRSSHNKHTTKKIQVNLPVETPQLRTQTLSRGASGLIFTTQPTCRTVYSLKVEVPTKW
jgi:hypothetical protein